MYPTLKATVRQGQIQLLEEADLPENATLLVIVLDDVSPEKLTLGDHLTGGLQDIMLGRVTEVNTVEELAEHLDAVFNEP
jgi:hypothetical protein